MSKEITKVTRILTCDIREEAKDKYSVYLLATLLTEEIEKLPSNPEKNINNGTQIFIEQIDNKEKLYSYLGIPGGKHKLPESPGLNQDILTILTEIKEELNLIRDHHFKTTNLEYNSTIKKKNKLRENKYYLGFNKEINPNQIASDEEAIKEIAGAGRLKIGILKKDPATEKLDFKSVLSKEILNLFKYIEDQEAIHRLTTDTEVKARIEIEATSQTK